MNKSQRLSVKRLLVARVVEATQLGLLFILLTGIEVPPDSQLLSGPARLGALVSASTWLSTTTTSLGLTIFGSTISIVTFLATLLVLVGLSVVKAIWPVKVLRKMGGVVTTTGYVPLLSACLLGVNASWASSLTAVVSYTIGTILFIVSASFAFVHFDSNPKDGGLAARAHSRVQVGVLFLKTFAILAVSFAPSDTNWRFYSELITFGGIWAVAGAYVFFQPFYRHAVNLLYTLSSSALAGYVTVIFLLQANVVPSQDNSFHMLQWIIITSSVVLSLVAAWGWRLFLERQARTAIKHFDQTTQLSFWVPSPWMVELVVRAIIRNTPSDKHQSFLRVFDLAQSAWPDCSMNTVFRVVYEVHFAAVMRARVSLKKAQSAKGVPFDGLFLLHKLEKDLERSMSAQSHGTGFDFLGHLEFMKSVEKMRETSKETQQLISTFWKQVAKNQLDFPRLQQLSHDVVQSISYVDHSIKALLAKFPTSPTVLRLFAEHLRDFKNDSSKAEMYFSRAKAAEADNAEKSVSSDNRAFLTIFLTGEVQMVSAKAGSLLGYSREDLVGGSINAIIPNMIAAEHDNMLKRFAARMEHDTSAGGEERRIRKIVACHRRGHLVPFTISLSVAVSNGQDVVVGELTPLEPVDGESANLLYVSKGIILGGSEAALGVLGMSGGEVSDTPLTQVFSNLRLNVESLSKDSFTELDPCTMYSRELGQVCVAASARAFGTRDICVVSLNSFRPCTPTTNPDLSAEEQDSGQEAMLAGETRRMSGVVAKTRMRAPGWKPLTPLMEVRQSPSLSQSDSNDDVLAPLEMVRRASSAESRVESPQSMSFGRESRSEGLSSKGRRRRGELSHSRWQKYKRGLRQRHLGKDSGLSMLRFVTRIITIMLIATTIWTTVIVSDDLSKGQSLLSVLRAAGFRWSMGVHMTAESWELALIAADPTWIPPPTEDPHLSVSHLQRALVKHLTDARASLDVLFNNPYVGHRYNIPESVSMERIIPVEGRDPSYATDVMSVWSAMTAYLSSVDSLLAYVATSSSVTVGELMKQPGMYFMTTNSESLASALEQSSLGYEDVLRSLWDSLVFLAFCVLVITVLVMSSLFWCTLRPVVTLVTREKHDAMNIFGMLDPGLARKYARQQRRRAVGTGDESDDHSGSEDEGDMSDQSTASRKSRQSEKSRRSEQASNNASTGRSIVGIGRGARAARARYTAGVVSTVFIALALSLVVYNSSFGAQQRMDLLSLCLRRQVQVNWVELEISQLVATHNESQIPLVNDAIDSLAGIHATLVETVNEMGKDVTAEGLPSHQELLFGEICSLGVIECTETQENSTVFSGGFDAIIGDVVDRARAIVALNTSALAMTQDEVGGFLESTAHTVSPLSGKSCQVLQEGWAEYMALEGKLVILTCALCCVGLVLVYVRYFRALVVLMTQEMMGIGAMIDMIPQEAVVSNPQIRAKLMSFTDVDITDEPVYGKAMDVSGATTLQESSESDGANAPSRQSLFTTWLTTLRSVLRRGVAARSEYGSLILVLLPWVGCSLVLALVGVVLGPRLDVLPRVGDSFVLGALTSTVGSVSCVDPGLGLKMAIMSGTILDHAATWSGELAVNAVSGLAVLILGWLAGIPFDIRGLKLSLSTGLVVASGVTIVGVTDTPHNIERLAVFFVAGMIISSVISRSGKHTRSRFSAEDSSQALYELLGLGAVAGILVPWLGGFASPIFGVVYMMWYQVDPRVSLITGGVVSGVLSGWTLFVQFLIGGELWGVHLATEMSSVLWGAALGATIGYFALHVASSMLERTASLPIIVVILILDVMYSEDVVSKQLQWQVLALGAATSYLMGIGGATRD